MYLYLVFCFIQHFLNSLLQMVQKHGWWKCAEVNILLHICYAALRPHYSPTNARGNILAFEKFQSTSNLKDTSKLWELEGFSLCILILEVGWVLVPLSQGLLLFKRATSTANNTFYKYIYLFAALNSISTVSGWHNKNAEIKLKRIYFF